VRRAAARGAPDVVAPGRRRAGGALGAGAAALPAAIAGWAGLSALAGYRVVFAGLAVLMVVTVVLYAFLETGDAFGDYAAREYLPSPSRDRFDRLERLGLERNRGLDLSEVAPAARIKAGFAAGNALYETLSRITLPPADRRWVLDQVMATEAPDAVDVVQRAMRDLFSTEPRTRRRAALSGD